MRRWALSLYLLALVAPGCGSSSSGGGTGSAQTTITVTSEGLPPGTRRIRGTVRDASGLVVAEPRDELLEAGRDTVLTLESGGAGNGTVFLEALRPGRVVAATTTVDLDDDRLTVSGSAFTDLAPRTVAISVLHAGLAAEATRIRVTLRSATTGESIVAPRTVALEAADETTVLFPSVLTSSGLDARCEALRADGTIVSTRTTRVSGHGVVVAGASFVPPDFSAPPPSPTGFDVLIDPKDLQPAGSPLQSSSIVAYWFDPRGTSPAR